MKIKACAVAPWPGNHYRKGLPHHPASESFAKPTREGDTVFTLGAPRDATANWVCGTDVVWPVLQINGWDVAPDDEGRMPHVCRHQIVAGD